jgi:hypothetical protein
VFPSALYASRRISSVNQSEPVLIKKPINWALISSLLLLTMPVILLLGNAVSSNDELAWILLPPLHVLAIALPVFWLVSMALHGLPIGSPQRTWGVFDVGLVLGPGLILFLEISAGILLFVLGLIYVVSQPQLLEELTYLAQRLSVVPGDPELILQILEPYVTNPAVLFIGLIFIAVIVPLIEEMFKPIGVWFLSGSKLSPAEGFAAGILSGAGFALFENLAFASGGSEWALAVITRAGTAVVHIFTASLMGWALALAWTKRKYLTLVITYIVAVLIHSLWNGLALFGMATYEFFPTSIQDFTGGAITGLIVMIVILFALLMTFNRRLRKPNLVQAEPVAQLESEADDESPWVM